MEALQVTFQELPLWQTCLGTTDDRSEPWWHAVWQCNDCHPDSPIYTNSTPPSSQTLPSLLVTSQQPSTCSSWAFWWDCNRPPPITLASVSQHSTPKRQPPSTALGALPAAEESKDPLRPEGTDSVTPVPMATLKQTSLQVITPASTLSSAQVTPQLPQPTLPKTPQVAGIPFITLPQAPSKGGPGWPVWWATSATGENEHGPYMITCKQGHQGFPRHLPAHVCWGLQCHKWVQKTITIPQSKACPPQGRMRGVVNIDNIPKEHPCKRWKGGLAGRALKESQRQAFSKESDVVKVARQAYQRAHRANFKQEGLCDLSSVFQQMATSTNLLGAEVYEVQEAWVGQKTSGLPIKQPRPPQGTSTSLRVVMPTEVHWK